jgi:hypothetical protein
MSSSADSSNFDDQLSNGYSSSASLKHGRDAQFVEIHLSVEAQNPGEEIQPNLDYAHGLWSIFVTVDETCETHIFFPYTKRIITVT